MNWTINVWLTGEKSYSLKSSVEYPSRAQAARNLPKSNVQKITRDPIGSAYSVIVSK